MYSELIMVYLDEKKKARKEDSRFSRKNIDSGQESRASSFSSTSFLFFCQSEKLTKENEANGRHGRFSFYRELIRL
jgi:hypothetical protein